MGGPDPPAWGPEFGPIETRPVRRLGVRRPPSGPGSQYPESQNPSQPNPRPRAPMPSLAEMMTTQRIADTQEHGVHPNTIVPTNWDRVGNLGRPLQSGGPWTFVELRPGPEQWHVYQRFLPAAQHAVVYVDALCRPLPASKRWRKGPPSQPDELQLWVVGSRATVLASDESQTEETVYQARRDRTDPVRIAALREQRIQARQAQLAQRREERRQRVLAERAVRRAEQAAGRNRQQAVRAVARLGQEAGGTEAAIGAAMQAVSNIGNPNAAPADTTTAAPAIDLASAWAFLQAKVPALIEAQEANTNTCSVCMDAVPNMAYTSCGHAVSCEACTDRTRVFSQTHRCPICRTTGNVIRLHFG